MDTGTDCECMRRWQRIVTQTQTHFPVPTDLHVTQNFPVTGTNTYYVFSCVLYLMRLHNAHIFSHECGLGTSMPVQYGRIQMVTVYHDGNTVLWHVQNALVFFVNIFSSSSVYRAVEKHNTQTGTCAALLQFVCTAELPHLAAASPLPLVLAVRNSKVSNSFANE